MNEPSVIMVEDNAIFADTMRQQLGAAGLSLRIAGNGRELDELLADKPSDILILDVILPGENAFSIAQRLYEPSSRGIIMLTVRGELEDKIEGLERGADIYLVKPVDCRELLACIHSLYRRLTLTHTEVDPEPSWSLDLIRRILSSPDGRTLELTPHDVANFSLLIRQPAKILSIDDISSALGLNYLNYPEARLYTQLSRLRHKLKDFDKSLSIQTWRNSGYTFVGPEIKLVHNEATAEGTLS
jgi:DNA-binding response OmpR family regulator